MLLNGNEWSNAKSFSYDWVVQPSFGVHLHESSSSSTHISLTQKIFCIFISYCRLLMKYENIWHLSKSIFNETHNAIITNLE